MTQLASIDYANNRIYLHFDTVNAVTGFNPALLYQEIKAARATTAAHKLFYRRMYMIGNIPKGGSKFTAKSGVLRSGVRIVPWDSSHDLYIKGEILNIDDALSFRGCFDLSGLTSGVEVNFIQDYSDVEIREVSTGSGLSGAESTKLDEIHSQASLLTFEDSRVAAAIGAEVVEGATTAAEMMRVNFSILAGKVSGAGTGTEVFYAIDGVTPRLTSTIDSGGNRTSTVFDGS